MGKNWELKICLSRPSKHYHPGEVVTGECVLNLSDFLKLRSLSIEFQGESWTCWEEIDVYTTTHKNAEIYFHKKTTLFGNCKYWTFKYSLAILSQVKTSAHWKVLQNVLWNSTFTVCKCSPLAINQSVLSARFFFIQCMALYFLIQVTSKFCVASIAIEPLSFIVKTSTSKWSRKWQILTSTGSCNLQAVS